MQNLTATLRIRRLELAASAYGLLFSLTRNRRFFDRKIKTGILLLSLLGLAASAEGQATGHPTKKAKRSKAATAKKDTASSDEAVFCYAVEMMPAYKGGTDSLFAFLARNTRYPQSGIENKKEGTVYVQFTIDSLGRVVNPRILKGIDPDFDAEALRVVRLMPPWIPGELLGKKANTDYTMPIKFRLTDVKK
ncbi:energy transducer TonB [uncultured Acetobacteroides sp.]|uniref:energy transducer TonB n=1 Tax=uncultured Acetobacteroides sp. TaxID=1760811 RepID=UPI0029F59DEB|nr:energy transducer TonB [uncultured Acetobacteroides sp.]